MWKMSGKVPGSTSAAVRFPADCNADIYRVLLFIRVDSRILQLVLRLLLIPVIAGVSYEFIRLAGRYDNRLVNILSKPGLWMQKMTTKEPDDEMIEVGIASVEAVFDRRKCRRKRMYDL